MANRFGIGVTREYKPLSLSPGAEGWQALYINITPPEMREEGEPAWWAHPLIAWAIFKVTVVPETGSKAPAEPEGRQIHGVVAFDAGMRSGVFGSAEDSGDFWRYAYPGQPDPTEQEVAEEFARWGRLHP